MGFPEIEYRIAMRKGLQWKARSKRGREAPKAMSAGARGLVTESPVRATERRHGVRERACAQNEKKRLCQFCRKFLELFFRVLIFIQNPINGIYNRC